MELVALLLMVARCFVWHRNSDWLFDPKANLWFGICKFGTSKFFGLLHVEHLSLIRMILWRFEWFLYFVFDWMLSLFDFWSQALSNSAWHKRRWSGYRSIWSIFICNLLLVWLFISHFHYIDAHVWLGLVFPRWLFLRDTSIDARLFTKIIKPIRFFNWCFQIAIICLVLQPTRKARRTFVKHIFILFNQRIWILRIWKPLLHKVKISHALPLGLATS